MDDITIGQTPIEPTPKESAYHLGWTSYFADGVNENPYDLENEVDLYEKWEEGWLSAEIITESMTNV